jgi:hypothetical protein
VTTALFNVKLGFWAFSTTRYFFMKSIFWSKEMLQKSTYIQVKQKRTYVFHKNSTCQWQSLEKGIILQNGGTHSAQALQAVNYCPQITSWPPLGMQVLRQCTVPQAEVMFVTIQRENIRPSKKEVNTAVTIFKLPDVCS